MRAAHSSNNDSTGTLPYLPPSILRCAVPPGGAIGIVRLTTAPVLSDDAKQRSFQAVRAVLDKPVSDAALADIAAKILRLRAA